LTGGLGQRWAVYSDSVVVLSALAEDVCSIKVVEPRASGPVETQIVVEAETIVDVPAGGFYYANLVLTGVPVNPPTKSDSARLLR
jgi:hypothetical protein